MVCVLPPNVTFLGEALGPIARVARQAIRRQVRLSGREFLAKGELARHIDVIQHALTRLSARLDSLMTEVIQKKGCSAVEAGRAAGRLEQVLSELVDGYLDVKASHASQEAQEVKALIEGVYRHYIREICDWLEEMVDVIANPAEAIKVRGIAVASKVELSVTLNMTVPLEMEKLATLTKRWSHPPDIHLEPLPSGEAFQSARPGLLGTIGAIAFGIGIARTVGGTQR